MTGFILKILFTIMIISMVQTTMIITIAFILELGVPLRVATPSGSLSLGPFGTGLRPPPVPANASDLRSVSLRLIAATSLRSATGLDAQLTSTGWTPVFSFIRAGRPNYFDSLNGCPQFRRA